jgi:nitric oxide reductase subunit C
VKTIASAAVLAAVIGFGAGTGRAGPDEGKALYEKKCHVCHSLAGSGGKQAEKGGPLDGVGKKRDAAWLKAYFADPKSKIPDAKMPKMKLTDQEWDDVTAYMLTLH